MRKFRENNASLGISVKIHFQILKIKEEEIVIALSWDYFNKEPQYLHLGPNHGYDKIGSIYIEGKIVEIGTYYIVVKTQDSLINNLIKIKSSYYDFLRIDL